MIRTSFLQDITEEDCGEDVETPETWRADWFFLSSWLMGKAMDIYLGGYLQAMDLGPFFLMHINFIKLTAHIFRFRMLD